MRIKTNDFVREYVNYMMSSQCECAIDLSTRITDRSKTLIDHRYVNTSKDNQAQTGVAVISDLSDHYGSYSTSFLSCRKLAYKKYE